MLDLKFAYSTNGPGIVEHDYTTGRDDELDGFPSPEELWRRDCARPRARSRRRPAPGPVLPRAGPRPALLPGHRDQPGHEAILKGSAASCSRWRPARARPSSRSRSAGSSGRRAGTAPASPQAAHPLPRRPQRPRRRPEGQDLRAVRRRAPQDRGRRREEPRDVLRDLPGDRRRRDAPGPLPGVPARLLRPHHRRRVPPRQRPRREQLARDPRVLRAGRPARHDRDAAPRDNRDTYRYFGNPIYTYSLRRASTTASSRRTACIAS